MAGEQILLDPTSEGTGTQLDISDNVSYFVLEHDYPTPDNDEVWAYSTDTEGERRANTRPKNRTITVKVRCIQPTGGSPLIGAIVSGLQGKVAKLNREGGTYKRILPSGDTITFDVISATIQVPADKQWITAKKADCTLTFTCAPYGRGAPVTLSTHTATAKAPLVFTETGIRGDVPALGTLHIANASQSKISALWGARSRYYDSGAGAALFLESENGSAVNAAGNAGFTGASGAGTNKVMRHSNVGTAQSISYRVLGAGSAELSHVGTYRVFARLQPSSTNTGTMFVSAHYGPFANNVAPISTPGEVALTDTSGTPLKGAWLLVDLGQVRIEKAAKGGQGWGVDMRVRSTVSTDDVDWDWLALVPADEGSGRVDMVNASIGSGDAIEVSDSGVIYSLTISFVTSWSKVPKYEGAYLRVPVAGAEARTVEFICWLAGDPDTLDGSEFDAITATLTYTPRYLAVPAP